jgi:hypothetical protein
LGAGSSDVHVPDPVITGTGADGNPESNAMLADSVGLALLVVLETLEPAERLAFVLHDVFGMTFDEIAPIVDRSPGTQLWQPMPRPGATRQRWGRWGGESGLWRLASISRGFLVSGLMRTERVVVIAVGISESQGLSQKT